MRHILTIILFSFFSFTVLAANFNTTGWKTYLSYNNTNSVEESNDQVFVVAEGSLYTYGKEDNSIKQYIEAIILPENINYDFNPLMPKDCLINLEQIINQDKNDLKQLEKDFTVLEQNIKENEKIINTAINQQQIQQKINEYQSELTAKAKILPNIQEKLSLVQKDFEIKSTSLYLNSKISYKQQKKHCKANNNKWQMMKPL